MPIQRCQTTSKGSKAGLQNPAEGKKYSKRSQVQGSTFSAASGHRSCQFDQKSDAGLAESHTRVRDRDKIEDPKSS